MTNFKCPINLSCYLEKLLHVWESDRSPPDYKSTVEKTLGELQHGVTSFLNKSQTGFEAVMEKI